MPAETMGGNVSDTIPPACTEDGLPEPSVMTLERIALVAKALGHPARLRIVQAFEECRPKIAQEIVAESALAQSTVSEHLRILREAEVLYARKDGSRTWYCLRRSVVRDFTNAVQDLAVERATARLGAR